MTTKRIILPLLLLILVFNLKGQVATTTSSDVFEYNKYRIPSITGGVGILSFFGDIGTYESEVWPIGKFNTGFQFGIEQRIGSALGVSLNGLLGSLAEIDNRKFRQINFKSDVFQGNLNLIFHFDNGFLLNKTSRLSPYITAGVGYFTFDPYTDKKDKNGLKYYFWPDGSIRDRELDFENPQLGEVIERDYKFETKIDSLNTFKKNALTLPVGIGFNFKFSDKLEANIHATYFFSNTDYIDGYSYKKIKEGKFFTKHNDGYFFSGVSLQYNLGGKSGMRIRNQAYKGVDFSTITKGDADGDKVKDKEDKCPDTPQGVLVDKSGCPLDDDKDGVPNYLDKEANTPLGSVVDENGVLLTAKMIEDKFIRDSLIMAGVLLLDKDSVMSVSDVDRSQVSALNNAYQNSLQTNTNNNTNTNNTNNNTNNTNNNTNNTNNNNNNTNNNNNNNTNNNNNNLNNTNNNGLIYRIQIGSEAKGTSKSFYQKTYNINEEIFVDTYQGAYKYAIGTFATYADARAYANTFKGKTGVGAFVISYNNGSRIPVSEAKVLSNE